MRPLTPQQIAVATAKRQAAVAARKASGGMTVRQQRAAAKAAKAGQPAPTPAPGPTPRPSFRRRRRHSYNPPPPRPTAPPAAPVFATQAPTARALKLTALAAVEALFKQRLIELGAANVTDEHRADFAKYKKLMGTALAPVGTVAMQNEADVALRLAVQKLVKHAF